MLTNEKNYGNIQRYTCWTYYNHNRKQISLSIYLCLTERDLSDRDLCARSGPSHCVSSGLSDRDLCARSGPSAKDVCQQWPVRQRERPVSRGPSDRDICARSGPSAVAYQIETYASRVAHQIETCVTRGPSYRDLYAIPSDIDLHAGSVLFFAQLLLSVSQDDGMTVNDCR